MTSWRSMANRPSADRNGGVVFEEMVEKVEITKMAGFVADILLSGLGLGLLKDKSILEGSYVKGG